jgi:hypothetical protein
MSSESILAGMNQEATQLELLGNITILLAAMLERMPRVTGNDQCAVSVEGTVTTAISANQDLRNITGSLALLSNISNLGGKHVSTAADAIAMTGVTHIYNQITVS